MIHNSNLTNDVLRSLRYYVYVYFKKSNNGQLTPIYIGKGIGTRCLDHLTEPENSEKTREIQRLYKEGLLNIYILRRNIDNEKIAEEIEAACIDLIGLDQLTNLVRGKDAYKGIIPLEVLTRIIHEKFAKLGVKC